MRSALLAAMVAALALSGSQALKDRVSVAQAAARAQLRSKADAVARHLRDDLTWLFPVTGPTEPLALATAARGRLARLAEDLDGEDDLGAGLLRRYVLMTPNVLFVPLGSAPDAGEVA